MTVLLLALGGAAAALGTRLCAVAFVGAAVLGARHPSSVLAAAATWTAALLAAWVLLDDGALRRVAVPALGAAAVLAAAGAPNGAVVLGLWVLGTAAAITTRRPGGVGHRWASMLCLSDLLLAGALASTAGKGFQGWPFTLPAPGVAAVLAAAAIRAPLSGETEDGPAPALAIIRLQSVLLVAYAATAAPHGVLRAIVVLGALGFAASTLARRRASVDGAQEIALVALAIATSRLQWSPSGWIWGALAAGTLMHQLRFILIETSVETSAGRFADAIQRSAGIGLPFLPVIVAQLDAAFRVRDWTSAVVLVGLLGGLAGRASTSPPRSTRAAGADRARPVRLVRAWTPILAAGAVALWAPLLSLPTPPAGEPTVWPVPWAIALVFAAGVAGTRAPEMAGARPDGVLSASARLEQLQARARVPDELLTGRRVWVLFALVAATAAGLWVVGLARGFL